MKIENNNDIDMTDDEIEKKIKEIIGIHSELFTYRNTVKILITASGDAVGLINTGVDVDIYEIGNIRTGQSPFSFARGRDRRI